MECPFNDKNPVFVYSSIKTEWKARGKDLCCSYCGSWHPREFLAFLSKVTNDNDIHTTIELNDRGEKIYITRPETTNGGDGAIKIYLIHLKEYIIENEFDEKEIEKQLHAAFVVSTKKAKLHADNIMDYLKKNP